MTNRTKGIGARDGRVIGGCWRGGLFLLALLAGGCMTAPIERDNADPDQPAADNAEPARSAAQTADPVTGAPVVVVLSDPGSRHLEMLQVFSARLGRPYQVLNIAHRGPDAVLHMLESRSPIEVIAIGPAAFDLTRTVPGLVCFTPGCWIPAALPRGWMRCRPSQHSSTTG